MIMLMIVIVSGDIVLQNYTWKPTRMCYHWGSEGLELVPEIRGELKWPLGEETGKLSPLLPPVWPGSIATPASLLILIMNHVMPSIPSVYIQWDHVHSELFPALSRPWLSVFPVSLLSCAERASCMTVLMQRFKMPNPHSWNVNLCLLRSKMTPEFREEEENPHTHLSLQSVCI